jgi:hypothetical protein
MDDEVPRPASLASVHELYEFFVGVSLVCANAALHRDFRRGRLPHHGGHDLPHALGVQHEACPKAALRHFGRRATAVQIDFVEASESLAMVGSPTE